MIGVSNARPDISNYTFVMKGLILLDQTSCVFVEQKLKRENKGGHYSWVIRSNLVNIMDGVFHGRYISGYNLCDWGYFVGLIIIAVYLVNTW